MLSFSSQTVRGTVPNTVSTFMTLQRPRASGYGELFEVVLGCGAVFGAGTPSAERGLAQMIAAIEDVRVMEPRLIGY